MNSYTEPAQTLPIYGQFDVIVIGGGPAGFASAVAAARQGASTLILERLSFFGGAATASLMAKINGFRNQVEPDDIQTTRGIGEELILRLKDFDGLGEPFYPKMKRYPTTPGQLQFSYTIDVEKYKVMTLRMLVASGARILLHTWFSQVIRDANGRVTGVIFENKSGRQAAMAKVVIDASGDGDVAARAGAQFWQTYHDEAKRLEDGLLYLIDGVGPGFTKGCRCTPDTAAVWGPKAGLIDATNADELTAGEIRARLAVYDHLNQLRSTEPGLENARIVQTPALLGVRQTRFIRGLYQITGPDVLAGASFDDSIAMASKPIIKFYGHRHNLTHAGYDLPYRCMLPLGVDGLLVVGRCMSSDQPAFESWRSMAPCMSLGQAAGTAAALAVKLNLEPKQLNVRLLQYELVRQNSEVGQAREPKRGASLDVPPLYVKDLPQSSEYVRVTELTPELMQAVTTAATDAQRLPQTPQDPV